MIMDALKAILAISEDEEMVVINQKTFRGLAPAEYPNLDWFWFALYNEIAEHLYGQPDDVSKLFQEINDSML